MTAHFTHIVCLECGHQMPPKAEQRTCAACGSAWLDARYDLPAVRALWEAGALRHREATLWRYRELLPVDGPNPEITMGEGGTALPRLYSTERLYGHQPIYVKDERKNPTNSFKDRQAAVSVTWMRSVGIGECVLASTGNAAVAYAAFCARAGIRLWLFMTNAAPLEKMREVALYGAEVVRVNGTYDEAKHMAAQFAQRRGIYIDTGAKAIPSKESMKTLAFEIAEGLGLVHDHGRPSGQFVAPDWYIQAVSGGIGPLGVMKGFGELYEMGLIDRVPKLGIIQAAGCAPMVSAYAAQAEKATPVSPKTLIHVLATGDPGAAYGLLRAHALAHGGAFRAVEDGDAFRAMRQVASQAGLSVEPAAAVAFAGLEQLLQDGTIQAGEVVVVNASGHTLTAEGHILGDQYDRYILSLNAQPSGAQLSTDLDALAEQVTTVVVVDDNPNDRKLIRRLLQSYKQYRVYEATDGADGLTVVRDRQPDLIVADLTMPEMDGLDFVRALKSDPKTSHIPVVVVSAKSITPDERTFLRRHTESVWTKGDFDTRQLVDHIVLTLGHQPVASPRREAVRTAQPEEAAAQHTILIIDDNPADLRLARRALSRHPEYQLIEASDGREGLKAIYAHHPDLIVLDLTLPELDGFTILDTLHNDRTLRDTPVIVLSAKGLNLNERTTLLRYTDVILEKAGFEVGQFAETVKRKLKPD
ncbi:MAG: pyridoxal-phosphate dependent enzyme [Anaerolineae bacterium]|nr:pyridoxal-phosphate dependent enzyme [Anaerolineae bacterium]